MADDHWYEAGIVYRSPTHDRTWIGVFEDSDQASTQAGPLRAVQAAMASGFTKSKWRRHDDGEGYTLMVIGTEW